MSAPDQPPITSFFPSPEPVLSPEAEPEGEMALVLSPGAEPEGGLPDSQGTELSSCRSDESVVMHPVTWREVKVRDPAFDIVSCGADDETTAVADKGTFKQALKQALVEKAEVERENAELTAEIAKLKGTLDKREETIEAVRRRMHQERWLKSGWGQAHEFYLQMTGILEQNESD